MHSPLLSQNHNQFQQHFPEGLQGLQNAEVMHAAVAPMILPSEPLPPKEAGLGTQGQTGLLQVLSLLE